MEQVKKELKYSIDNDEITVWLDKAWPVGHIYTNNYKLIDYVLNDINKNYLTINGALFYVKDDNNEIRDIMKKNKFKLMNRAYKIKNNVLDIDKEKFSCSSIINNREKKYFAKCLNELYNVNTGLEIINSTLEKEYYKVYAFYKQEELVGITTISLIDNKVSLQNLFSNDSETAKFILQYITNQYKSEIFAVVANNHIILNNVLEEIGAEIQWSNYHSENN